MEKYSNLGSQKNLLQTMVAMHALVRLTLTLLCVVGAVKLTPENFDTLTAGKTVRWKEAALVRKK